MSAKDELDEHVQHHLAFLISEHAFVKCNGFSEGQSFRAEFYSRTVKLRIEKYRREVYVYLYAPTLPDHEINLFVLLEFLFKGEEVEAPKSKYFTDAHVKKSLKLQVEWIGAALKTNMRKIQEFFQPEGLENRIRAVNRFVVHSHPELFTRKHG